MSLKSFFTTFFCIVSFAAYTQVEVLPTFETDPPANWNGADDPAIWLHPTDGDACFFIGVDKKDQGRLELYNMDGSRFWSTPAGTKYNNVDVTYNFALDNDTIDLVVACNNSDNTIDFYQVDPINRELILLQGDTDCGFNNLYGLMVYHDLCNEKFYTFLNRRTTDGYTYQFEFVDNGAGGIDITLVRLIDNLPSRTEGMVADYRLGHLYISEEDIGIWKYGAAPEDGLDRILIDEVAGGNLAAAVEGLAIYYSNDSIGYLLCASQGSNDYQVYTREGDNEYLGNFELIDNDDAGVDGVSQQDGIDVVSYPIPGHFPNGVFITQDTDNNDGEFSNYKIVPWENIAIPMDLRIDTTFSPRDLLESLCDTIPVDTIDTTSTFIQNLTLAKTFVLYPNPAKDFLNIQGIDTKNADQSVIIYNSLGEEILRQNLQEVVAISHLAPGIYLVTVGNRKSLFIKE